MCAKNDKNIILGARQIGKTTLCCLFSLWYATQFSNKKISFYVNSYLNAYEIYKKIKISFNSITLIDKPTIINETEMSLLFSNGSSITLYTYDKQLNKTSSDCVICDEMAFTKHDNNFTLNILNSIPKVIIITTPYKNKGVVYDIWTAAQNNQNKWKSYMIQWKDICLRDIYSDIWKQEIIDAISIKRWKNEFECEFYNEDDK